MNKQVEEKQKQLEAEKQQHLAGEKQRQLEAEQRSMARVAEEKRQLDKEALLKGVEERRLEYDRAQARLTAQSEMISGHRRMTADGLNFFQPPLRTI